MTRDELRRKLLATGNYQIFKTPSGDERFIKNNKEKSFFVLGESTFSFGNGETAEKEGILYSAAKIVKTGFRRFAVEF